MRLDKFEKVKDGSWKELLQRFLNYHSKLFFLKEEEHLDGALMVRVVRRDSEGELPINLYFGRTYKEALKPWHILEFVQEDSSSEEICFMALDFLCNEDRDYYDMEEQVFGDYLKVTDPIKLTAIPFTSYADLSLKLSIVGF